MSATEAERNRLSTIRRVVGNLETLGAFLKDNDGEPFVLTGWAVAFRLVAVDVEGVDRGDVKVDNAAAAVADANAGEVAYSPVTANMDTAGVYAMYWIATKAGEPDRRWPYDGARWLLDISAETEGR